MASDSDYESEVVYGGEQQQTDPKKMKGNQRDTDGAGELMIKRVSDATRDAAIETAHHLFSIARVAYDGKILEIADVENAATEAVKAALEDQAQKSKDLAAAKAAWYAAKEASDEADNDMEYARIEYERLKGEAAQKAADRESTAAALETERQADAAAQLAARKAKGDAMIATYKANADRSQAQLELASAADEKEDAIVRAKATYETETNGPKRG